MKLKVSQGEKLFLDRREKGLTQPQMALFLNIDYYEYRRKEQEGSLHHTAKDIPHDVCRGDYCTVIRRRLGLSQNQVAEKLGTSRYCVNRMELSRLGNIELYNLMKQLARENKP